MTLISGVVSVVMMSIVWLCHGFWVYMEIVYDVRKLIVESCPVCLTGMGLMSGRHH